MLPVSEPKFRRRKEDRPAEIIAAALTVFAEKGFAAARLDDIARAAGLSKGALYLYFETKEDLFAAVVGEAIAPRLGEITALAEAWPGSFAALARMALPRIADMAATQPIGAVARLVIGESRNFPELARVWHDRLVSPALQLLGGLIARAQARGEIRAGDPRLQAFSLITPMLVGVIWRETFVPIGAPAFDLAALARQHLETVLDGLLVEGAPA